MNRHTKRFVVGLFAVVLLCGVSYAYAQPNTDIIDRAVPYTGLGDDPKEQSFAGVAGTLGALALGVVAIVFFALMVYAGIRWMISRGNEQDVTAARNTIIASVIGLVIVAGAFAISTFVSDRFVEAPEVTKTDPLPDTVGDQPLGCCSDKISDGGLAGPEVWACAMITQDACQKQITSCDEDNFCGAFDGYWDKTITQANECTYLCTDVLSTY